MPDRYELESAVTRDEAKLLVRYSGDAIISGTMDLADLVPALDGIRQTLISASSELNHGSAQPQVRISADLHEGSFEFSILLVQLVETATTIAPMLRDSAEIAKAVFSEDGLVGLLKFLAGAKDKDVGQVTLGNGSVQFSVGGIGNTVNLFIAPPDTAQLYRRPSVRGRLWNAVKPLTKPGIDRVFFRPENAVGEIVAQDARGFEPPSLEELLEDDSFHTVEEIVDVIKPAFRKGKKWKLAIGESVFGAIMGDTAFQNKVQLRKILFGTGDKLRVQLGVKKHKKAPPDYVVGRVLEIIRPPEQLSL